MPFLSPIQALHLDEWEREAQRRALRRGLQGQSCLRHTSAEGREHGYTLLSSQTHPLSLQCSALGIARPLASAGLLLIPQEAHGL